MSVKRTQSNTKKTTVRWGVLSRFSKESLDGAREYIVGDYPRPSHCFPTRREARAFIKERWGYIASRPDLRKAPHGWRMPIPVRVLITVEVAP
jgi:hypothetical protein